MYILFIHALSITKVLFPGKYGVYIMLSALKV